MSVEAVAEAEAATATAVGSVGVLDDELAQERARCAELAAELERERASHSAELASARAESEERMRAAVRSVEREFRSEGDAHAATTAVQFEALLSMLDFLGAQLPPLSAAVGQAEARAESEMQLAQQWRSRRRELQTKLSHQEDEVRKLKKMLALPSAQHKADAAEDLGTGVGTSRDGDAAASDDMPEWLRSAAAAAEVVSPKPRPA